MFAESIALLTLAVMLGSEASRAKPPWSHGLWSLTTIILLIALGLRPLSRWVPELGAFVSDIFSSPVAWLVLFVGLFLVLRPFWTKPKASAPPSRAELLSHLYEGADRIINRIRNLREVKWIGQPTEDDFIELARDGQSLLFSFAKAGLPIPKFSTNSVERVLIGQYQYFSALCPLIRDGHTENIEELAAGVAERAQQAALSFNVENWYVRRL